MISEFDLDAHRTPTLLHGGDDGDDDDHVDARIDARELVAGAIHRSFHGRLKEGQSICAAG